MTPLLLSLFSLQKPAIKQLLRDLGLPAPEENQKSQDIPQSLVQRTFELARSMGLNYIDERLPLFAYLEGSPPDLNGHQLEQLRKALL